MRRFFILGGLAALLLVLVGTGFLAWIGQRGGLTPVSPASPGAENIQDIYVFIGAFASAIFLVVTVPLALFILRFRANGRAREIEGPQIRGNTRLELLWTVIPILILIAIAAFTFAKLGPIRDAPAAAGEDVLRVRVEGRQFYWLYEYENGAVAVDTLRLPVDTPVHLEVSAPEWDVIHSFWVPALGGKVDAIPGQTNTLEYRATRTGVFRAKCAELCGIQHTAMVMDVEVLEQGAFQTWLDEQAGGGGQEGLGQAAFERVCSKCHFAAPEYAPNIAGNPLLANRESMRRIITEGVRRMPPVGRDWPEPLLESTLDYLESLAPQGSAG